MLINNDKLLPLMLPDDTNIRLEVDEDHILIVICFDAHTLYVSLMILDA